jgi:hypothetical protein
MYDCSWSCLYFASWGTRRCPGRAMAKSDSILFLYNKKRLRNLWKRVTVKYAPYYPRKASVLTQNADIHVQEKEDSFVNEYNVLLYN